MENLVNKLFKELSSKDQEKVIRSAKEFKEKMEVGTSYFEVVIDILDRVYAPMFFILNSLKIMNHEIGERIKLFYPKYDHHHGKFINDFFWEGKFVVKGDKKLAEKLVRQLTILSGREL